MMMLKLFRTREREFLFGEQDWLLDELKKNYSLSLDLGNLKVRSTTRFILCILQSNRYIFHSEGSESVVGSTLRYFSHFPFAGKVTVKR